MKLPAAFLSFESSIPVVASLGTHGQQAATVATLRPTAPQLSFFRNVSVNIADHIGHA
jgi:hypothetical protein